MQQPDPSNPEEVIKALIDRVAVMEQELMRWRLLGPFDLVARNMCYLSHVVTRMNDDPNLKQLLIQYMFEFQEKTLPTLEAGQMADKEDWLREAIEGMNLGGTTSTEDTTP